MPAVYFEFSPVYEILFNLTAVIVVVGGILAIRRLTR